MTENAPEATQAQPQFDPNVMPPPKEAPQTAPPADAPTPAPVERLEVERTETVPAVGTETTATANETVPAPGTIAPGTLTPVTTTVPEATSNDTPAADQPRDAHPVLVHLEHVIQTVDLFVEQHPGLDRIFATGLKDALLAVEHATL
jgi:hypothetical protein